MKWSCKRQLWIEMARVLLHSAICSGKASQHSDSSLTNKTLMALTVNIFWHSLTQKLPLVPFSNWKFLWVGFAAPHFAEGSWYRQKHVCSFRTPSASRNSRPFFPSTNIGPSKDGRPGRLRRLGRSWKDHSRWKFKTKKPMKYTLFWALKNGAMQYMQWFKVWLLIVDRCWFRELSCCLLLPEVFF